MEWWGWFWRLRHTRYLSGPTNVSSIVAAIVFRAFFAFFVWKWIWRLRQTRYLSGPTHVSSILAAIVFFAFVAFFVRLGSGLFGGPLAAI